MGDFCWTLEGLFKAQQRLYIEGKSKDRLLLAEKEDGTVVIVYQLAKYNSALCKYHPDTKNNEPDSPVVIDSSVGEWKRYESKPKTKTYYRPKLAYNHHTDVFTESDFYPWYHCKLSFLKCYQQLIVVGDKWEQKEFPIMEQKKNEI